ncbi:MAG: Holliday junction resolvase RuvX [Dehalococcoidia bacterium]|nr:Holliday junction resolvase RuvX [Dehalococcoidia bacterium]
MRIIGIDFGEKRIGVAAADDRLRVAVPVEIAHVDGDPVEAVVGIALEQRADELVVGMPLSLTGAEGPQAQRVRRAVEEIARRVAIPVRTYDERLTTAQARRGPVAPGRGRGGQRGGHRDAAAAAIMLQAYLDSQRPHG